MDRRIQLGIATVVLVGTVGWSVSKSMRSVPGSVGNNGYTTEFPMPSAGMRKSMEKMMKDGPPRPPEGVDPTTPEGQEQMREHIESQLDPSQREEFKKFSEDMKKRMERTRAALSPKEQQQLMQVFMKSFGRGRRGFGGPRGGDGGGSDESETQ